MTDTENVPEPATKDSSSRNPAASIAGDPYVNSRVDNDERERAEEEARVRSAAKDEADKADAVTVAEAQAAWEEGVLADAKAKAKAESEEAEDDEDLVTDEDEAQAEATAFYGDRGQAETDNALYDQAEADKAFE